MFTLGLPSNKGSNFTNQRNPPNIFATGMSNPETIPHPQPSRPSTPHSRLLIPSAILSVMPSSCSPEKHTTEVSMLILLLVMKQTRIRHSKICQVTNPQYSHCMCGLTVCSNEQMSITSFLILLQPYDNYYQFNLSYMLIL